jgi:hypothetical protein
MSAELVPWRRPAVAIAGVCAALVAAMGYAFHDQSHGSWFDQRVDPHIGRINKHVLLLLLHLSDPPAVVVAYVVLIVVLIVRQRWRSVALAALTPAVAILSVEHILKPAIYRTQYLYELQLHERGALAFPSGHETGVGSFLAVCGLLASTAAWSRGVRITVVAAIVVVALLAAVGLVGRFYHFATDTFGAILYCVAVVLVVGLLIDWVVGRLGPRAGVRA